MKNQIDERSPLFARHGRRALNAMLGGVVACVLAHAALVHADEAKRHDVNIAPTSLASALNLLAAQTGLQVLVLSEDAKHKRVPAVSGNLTQEEALSRLLRDSGLTYRRIDDNTIAVHAPTAATSGRESASSETEVMRLEEVIVTGTRRAASVASVPYNVQAITADTLRTLGARDLKDFSRTIPGLSVVDRGARDGGQLILRGLTTGAGANNELGLTTTTYVDDTQVDLATGLLDLSLIDIERVEVLRGPQGTLYGGGSMGGTIRYITRKPDLFEREAELGARVSSSERGGFNYGAQAMVNVPLVEDALGLRAALGYVDNEGFIDNPRRGLRDVNWDRTLSGRIALLFRPLDDVSAEVTHYLQRGRYGDNDVTVSDRGELQTDFYYPAREEREVNLTNLTVTWDLGFAALTSSTSYADERADGRVDATTFVRDQYLASVVPPEALPELWEYTTDRRRSRTTSQELRVVSNDQGRWNWLAGLYWFDRKTRSSQQEWVPRTYDGRAALEQALGDYWGAPVLLNDDKEYTIASDPLKIRQWAAFGELGLRLTTQLRVAVSARYFDYSLRERFYAIDQFSPFGRDEQGFARTEPLAEEHSYGAADDTGELYRFNSSYQISERALVYLTVAEGYRTGGFNLVTPNTGVPLNERKYDPDTIVSYESGAKLTLADGRVYLSPALYYIDWTDIQVSVPTSMGFAILGNAGKASSKGVELELQTRDVLARGLTLTLTYAFTDAKLEETINDLGYEGQRVPRVARHAGSFLADYEWQLANGWSAGLATMTTYTGSSQTTFGATVPDLVTGEPRADVRFLEQDEYWLTGVSARLTNDTWTARLFVDNAFDERAQLLRDVRDIMSSPYRSSFNEEIYIRPRTVGLEVFRRFR